jgi:hypothetical protein
VIIWATECRRNSYYYPGPALANLRWKAEGRFRESGVAICKEEILFEGLSEILVLYETFEYYMNVHITRWKYFL